MVPMLALALGASVFGLPTPSGTITVSNERAGARPVAISIVLRYEMQCGSPGTGTVVLTFPASERLPRTIPAADVTLNGKRAPAATLAGRQLTIQLPKRPPVICDVIGPGALTIGVSRAAGIGNPRSPGRYTFVVEHGLQRFTLPLTIRG